MSEGYYSVSSNGSDGQTRHTHRTDALKSKMKEALKQSNMRSSSTMALHTLSNPNHPVTSGIDARAEQNAPSQTTSRPTSNSTTAASMETVVFRSRAKSNAEGEEIRDAAAKVPRAAVLPRSASVFALNSQQHQHQRLGMAHPMQQDFRRPLSSDYGRHGPPQPYLPQHHHQYQRNQPALPSYPAHPYPPHPPGELPVAPLSTDAPHRPCVTCGVYFVPQSDDYGVIQNLYCPNCFAQRYSQQQQQQQQQPLRHARLSPSSPSKRGSWHGAPDYPASPSSGSSSSHTHPVVMGYPPASRVDDIPHYSSQYSYPSMARSTDLLGRLDPMSNVLPPSSAASSEPSKFDSLRQTAGSIIKEKDAVIEKQRHQIQQLEQLARQAQHQSEMAAKQRPYDPYSLQQQSKELDVQMQEFQYETASVRAQLKEAASSSKMELDDLTRKLAETELDAERSKVAFKEETHRQRQIIEDVGKKLTERRADYDELKLKYKTKEKELSRAKKNLSNIETYLANLPTPQEVEEREARLEELEAALHRMEARTQDLETHVAQAKGEAEAKVAVIQSLEQAEEEWKSKLELSNRERDKYRDLLRSLRGAGAGAGTGGDSDSGVSVEDMEDEIQRLKGDAERLKKLVETQQKRHKVQQRDLKMEQQDLEEQLRKEQEKASQLETRLKQRDAEVERLRDRASDDDSIKESLRERVAQLTDELADANAGGEEAALKEKMQQRLSDELVAAFTELQGLVQICNDEVEGKDPNMSVLLGLRRSEGAAAAGSEAGALDATARLAQAKALRKEVDRLRSVVSNKIAENLGDNLDCTQQ